ncbi:hypothetical protein TrLO_g661 [Triparma laevis f. longispina]|uniref:PIPK domain-containing protein n=1 Tax=Triparma laevis f. longispina TaxID=1714387 RepID=A0A9W7FQT1_9STRA|nr:hypothetical protein TrLO_g661 [Triparma laevis f. longispina]
MRSLQLLPSLLGFLLSIRMASILLKSKLKFSRSLALSTLPVINTTNIDDPLSEIVDALSSYEFNQSYHFSSSKCKKRRKWFKRRKNETVEVPKCLVEGKECRVEAMYPEVFERLRESFNIPPHQHTSRLTSTFRSFKSNSKGSARANTLFFFSSDGAYLIKTVPKRERKVLGEILGRYEEYMKNDGGRSLLTRFCGMYDVRRRKRNSWFGGEETLTLVVMNSIFPVNAEIEERYDLKGSTVGRICKQAEIDKKGTSAVLKDLNLASSVASEVRSLGTSSLSKGYGFNISFRKSRFMRQLSKDVEFLKTCGVMDYSLLCGVKSRKTWLGIFRRNKPKRTLEILETPDDDDLKIIEAITPRKLKRLRLRKKITQTLKLIITTPINVTSLGLLFLKNVLLGSEDGGYTCGVSNGPVSVINGKRFDRGCVYYFGVIDFLQPWSVRKVFERQGKGMMGFDVNAISCVNPKFYGERLINFIDTHVT